MARTIEQIEADIIAAKQADPVLAGLTSTSAVAIWRKWANIAAQLAWTEEKLFDELRKEIELIIAAKTPHHEEWYSNTAKDFQYGYSLATGKTFYDNTGIPDEEVAASKIVKHAAVVKRTNANGRTYLRVLVAKELNGELAQLDADEMAAFVAYMERVADAGVIMEIYSLPADSLKMKWRIYFDPLILNSQGQRLDGTVSSPVVNGIKSHLKQMIYNGKYRPTHHVDAVQQIEGVKDPIIVNAQVRYGALPYSFIVDDYQPDGGYMRIENDEDLEIEFFPMN